MTPREESQKLTANQQNKLQEFKRANNIGSLENRARGKAVAAFLNNLGIQPKKKNNRSENV